MMRVAAFLFAIALIPTGTAAQQNFSCSWGDRGACLGYGETVCSSSGRCVSQDAVCFDSYQCNYEGFTCKSHLTECAEEIDDLRDKFNSLVDDYNDILGDNRELQTSLRSAREELEDTRAELDDTQRDLLWAEDALMNLRQCIEGLGRLEAATKCLP